MEITINQNENQLITISNDNVQDISINQNDNQLLTIETPTTPEIDISQRENQTIYIDGGGVAIGVSDVLVNGVSVVSGNIAYVIVPTKTSELENDSHFITTETDPTVPTVVKQITLADINNWNSKQAQLISGSTIKTVNNESLLGSGNINIEGTTYTAGDGISIENNIITNEVTSYNDLTDLPDIPTKTSDLLNDSDFVSEDDLSEVAFTGSYNSLSDTPIIPDSTSELTNDSDFITSAEVSTELATKQDLLVSGTNIKTINSNSILGSGDLVIGGGSATDVQINGTSIVSNNVANIITESAYNSSTNKIATKSDIPTSTSALTNDSNFAVTNANNNFSANQSINGQVSASGSLITTGNDTGVICDNTQATTPRKTKFTVSNNGNSGIYDNTNSSWIIRSDTSQNVYIPHPLTTDGTFKVNNNSKYINIAPQSASYVNYETDVADGHYFNKNVYVNGNVYGGSSYNKQLAFKEDIATKVTFNSEWIHANLSNGGGWKMLIPLNNPNKTRPTLSLTSVQYFNGASWVNCSCSLANTFETFVTFNLSGINMPNNEVVLVRLSGTLTL